MRSSGSSWNCSRSDQDETIDKKEIIISKLSNVLDEDNDYNRLVDIETIIDNIDCFIAMKNAIQKMGW